MDKAADLLMAKPNFWLADEHGAEKESAGILMNMGTAAFRSRDALLRHYDDFDQALEMLRGSRAISTLERMTFQPLLSMQRYALKLICGNTFLSISKYTPTSAWAKQLIGFSEHIIEALHVLSRLKSTPYHTRQIAYDDARLRFSFGIILIWQFVDGKKQKTCFELVSDTNGVDTPK